MAVRLKYGGLIVNKSCFFFPLSPFQFPFYILKLQSRGDKVYMGKIELIVRYSNLYLWGVSGIWYCSLVIMPNEFSN